ncbi:MAG: hypothetical protein R6U17_03995 [Thermoplasmata archaeon]
MRKIPFPLLITGFIVVVFGIFSIALITGVFPVGDPLTHFYAFVFALVLVSVFAMIGAIFLGMFISHRVFSSQEFTAFEEEMLKMKNDIDHIRKKLEESEEN